MTQSCKLYTFIWKIENFSLSNHKSSEFIISPHFTIEALNHSKWYIKLYPKHCSQTSENHLSVFLYRDDADFAKEETIDFKLETVNGNEISLCVNERKNEIFGGTSIRGWAKFILLKTLVAECNNWIKNVITIRCDISSKQYNEDEQTVCGCNALTKIGIDQCVYEWPLKTPNLDSQTWRKKKSFLFLPAPIEITITAPEKTFEIHISKAKGFPSPSRPILCRFSLLSNDGKISASKIGSYLFGSSESDIWKFPTFLTKSDLEVEKDVFVHGNTFTLKCEISISNGTVSSCIENYMFQSSSADDTSDVNLFASLHDDLRSMFMVKKHCDVQLKFSDCTIPVHKAVLAARSPVFSAMFDQNMLENQSGVVNIEDVEANTMHDLLECIYTGSVKELNYESAFKLLIAADKYDILSLKRKCSKFLASILSISNACDVLSMAAVIDKPLKNSAMDYIIKNFKKVMSSQVWSDWVENNHALTTEVFLTLSNCMKI